MTKGEMRKFINNWAVGFVSLVGLFLIYVDTTLIGVLMYGAMTHILLIVIFNTIYSDVALANFIEKVRKNKKPWLHKLIGRLLMSAWFGVSLYVLALKDRWYLFVLTCALIILGAMLVNIMRKELRGSKMVIL